MQRRKFVQGALAGSALVSAASLLPQSVLAEWPKAAFEAKDVNSALDALVGSSDATDSGDIAIKAPEIAENGAVVPVQVTTSLPDIESISIIADQNPVPLVASFKLSKNSVGYVSTRIKMGKTGNVVAVVKAGGKLYQAKQEVKVTIGGCGG
jgi:sulfur-oxidizing protein SoxY